MKIYFLCFVFVVNSIYGFSSVSIISWNLKDLGDTKSNTELEIISKTIKGYDIAVIQEVVSGDGGAQTIDGVVNVLLMCFLRFKSLRIKNRA